MEVVDHDNRQAEVVSLLRHYLERARSGDPLTGIMIVLETPVGGYECRMSATDNVAERLGRLELLKESVLDEMEPPPSEEVADPGSWMHNRRHIEAEAYRRCRDYEFDVGACGMGHRLGWWCQREVGHDGPCAANPLFTEAEARVIGPMPEMIHVGAWIDQGRGKPWSG